ncbi:hypothetical protein pb186bvf_017361 [Paramecium bursaria]
MISQIQLTNEEAKQLAPELDIQTYQFKNPQELKKMLDLKNVPKLKQIQIFNIRMPSDLKLLGITNALIADIYNYI